MEDEIYSSWTGTLSHQSYLLSPVVASSSCYSQLSARARARERETDRQTDRQTDCVFLCRVAVAASELVNSKATAALPLHHSNDT